MCGKENEAQISQLLRVLLRETPVGDDDDIFKAYALKSHAEPINVDSLMHGNAISRISL
jgi:hypothetical protein